MRTFLVSAIVLAAAAAAHADDLPDGIGVVTPSGSVFTTEITANDTDDYVFQGYPGMKLTATVKAAKGSTLVPGLKVIRPGGTVVADEEGLSLKVKPTSVKAGAVLDAVGWWKVRVAGSGGSTGAYTVSVKYTAPALAALPLVSRSFGASAAIEPSGDDDEFAFQGYSGQTLKATLTVPKTSALDAMVQLIRPDGSVAVTAGRGTVEVKIPVATTLDASGTWRLKVVGEEVDTGGDTKVGSTGPYLLSVKLGKVAAPGLVADANGQYRFTIPAAGGGTFSYKLTFDGGAPTFNSIVAPDGGPVAGFPGGTAPRPFTLSAGMPFGPYTVTFDAPQPRPTNVRVVRSVVPPKGAKKRVAKLSESEPLLRTNGINPVEGGPGTLVAVQVTDVVDPFFEDGVPLIQLGHIPLEGVQLLPDGVTVRGTVPDTLPEGVFDVVVMSTSGQPAAKAGAFRRVPPPQVSDIDPSVGSSAGGFPVTITGSNFRPGRMGILIDGFLTPVLPTETTESSITFNAPPRAPGFVIFGVKDLDTQLTANLPLNSFEYVAAAAISRIVPSLIPILGNELVTVQGANFSATDSVYVETTTPGVYERMNDTQVTYVNSKTHQFNAPTRPKGVYRVHVQDAQGQPDPPKTRDLTYYTFADFTASTNLGTLADPYDGITTAVADYDGDGDQDLFVTRRGNPADTAASASSLTRVLRNDGNGTFTDRTSSVMPSPVGDDWRADRIWAADVNQDGRPDLVLSTNTVAVPAAGLSHTRILLNEPRGGASGTGDRVFRDRTLDLMAPPRQMQRYGVFGGDASFYVADNWRGLDMWVGDIDKGGAGPPEILVTHDEVKDDDNPNDDVFQSGVYCGNYCSSVQYFAYSYTFYWGGSRLFVWDKTANSGQGRYKFDPNFFPRKSGPVVPQTGPGGISIPPCSPHYSRICKASFTPFTGKRLAVGNLDTDGKPDVAVVSDQVIQRRDKPNDPLYITSSLQVGINKFNSAEGSGVTDVTKLIYNLGGATLGDVVAIGQPGYPDGNSYGVIAFGRSVGSGGGSVLRLVKFKPGVGVGDFEDISNAALPAPDANDQFQATRLAWIDIDADGDQDLVLLAPAAPGGTGPALRIMRNERSGNTVGAMRRTLDPLLAALVTGPDHFEGDALSIGDLTGDGYLDYAVTRATVSGAGTQTRIVKTDR